MQKKQKGKNGKISLIVGTTANSYSIIDRRLMKPICHQKLDNANLQGSMLLQEIDQVSLNRSRKISYFVPNNISLLLSVSEKSLKEARMIHAQYLSNKEIEFDLNNMTEDRKGMMGKASSLVCDYLESIQTSIVFGYTALEAFVNLSIPSDYTYKTDKNNKGICEIFDKNAIERWLPLKTKVKSVLSDVYSTKSVTSQNWWDNFICLENYRNEIIHQKSINHTEFYKVYFKPNIFKICESPSELIQFFHDSHISMNRTNPIWPWLKDDETLPVNTTYNASQFEVIGNLYEGFRTRN
ncbi:hypothetical protein [Oceanospirillum sanctuarii]|uniref:hypothetical protein n=1 Tax=Oceanospirillum sanctuarii TaxID=1434821 RepID=UPI000A3D3E7A|nr:hypothetical protein [Oceanospirillum sanctuarii]